MVKLLHNLIINDIDTDITCNHLGFTFTFSHTKTGELLETINTSTYKEMTTKVREFSKRVLK